MGKKHQFPGFAKCMEMMRSRNAKAQEDGFNWLRPHAAEYVEELIAEFHVETNDRGLRCWVLELIGEARDPRAIPLLAEQLESEDESLRDWAAVGLRLLDTAESRRILFEKKAPGAMPTALRGHVPRKLES